MAQGRVKIGVGFDVDKSGLNELKSSLVNLQNATKLDVFNTSTTKEELAEIQQSANQVAAALNKSYNAKLGTYNIEAFKKEINATTGGLSALQQQWSKVATGERAFRNLANSLTSTNLELKETHSLLDSMGTTLMNTIKWSIASTAVNTVTGSIQKAWSFTKQLDESLTNIMIVTEKSSDQMAAFARQANTAAKALGASTRAYSDAALIYYQQGLGDDEVISRTNTTLKAANVTGQNAAQVSEQLTAVWNGYKVAAQETELYVDKLSAVAATTAADLEELSTGMSKVASAASTMGVDIDQLNAQLATVISVTRQAPESVGTAFKTIFARMGDIEAGLDTETTLGEYTSKMEAMGFHVLDANNQLRDQGEVIEEIGAKWKSLSREQQIALAQTMAGTRQYNNLLALFDNWGMYEKALQTSANAAGTLSQQNEEYLDSLEAKMQQLTTTAEDLYLSLFDSDSFKDGIDLLTKGVDVLGQFVESVGGGGTVLLSLGTIMTRVFSKQISQSIATTATNFINAKQNAEALATTMQNIKDLDALDMDEATKSILNMKERLVSLRQAGLLTNEQFEDLTRQIKDFSDAADEASMIRERAQQLDNSMRFNPIVLSRSAQEEQYPKGGTKNYNLQKVIEQSEAQYQELGTTNIDTNTAYGNLKKQLAAMVEDAIKFKTTINEALQNFNTVDIEKFQKDLSGSGGWFALSESDLVSEETVSRIKEVSSELASLTTKMKQSNITVEEREALQKEYANLVKNKLSPLWKEAEKEANKTAEEIRKTGEEIANGALHASDVTVKGIQDTFKKIDLTQAIQKVVNFTSALGSAVSALNILGNIDDIWSNEDLSAGEKMTQTIMNVTSAAGMLLPVIQGIASWTIKNKAAKEAENIAIAKSAANLAAENKMKRLKLALDKAEGDAIKTKNFWLRQTAGIKRQLTKEEKEEIELLRTENKELSQNTKEKLLNLQADKVRDKTYNENYKESTIFDVFSAKWDKTKLNFKQGWQGFTGAAAKGSSAAATVGAGIAAALPYAIALAAVVATIAISWSTASKKNQEEQKAWEKAAKAAESAREQLAKVNQEWDNLESSLSAIKSQEETIANLTEGTIEWKKALFDVNNEITTLISKYPELAQYIMRDASTGQLSISETGQQVVQEKQLAELTQAQGAAALAGLVEAQAKQDKLLNDLVDQNSDADVANAIVGAGGTALTGAAIGSIGGPIGMAIGAAIGGTVGVVGAVIGTAVEDANEENRKAIIANSETYKAAMEAYSLYGAKVYESEESLSKALEGVENVDKDLITSLVENSEETRALAEAYAQQKAQAYDQKVALGGSIIGEDASEGAKYLAGNVASVISEDFKKQIEKELKGGNDKDEALAREWIRLTGITGATTIDTDGKNKVVVKDAKGETLGDYNAEDLLDIVTQLRWQEELAAKGGEEAQAAWQEVSNIIGDAEIENALSQILGGAKGASFESLTKEEFERLEKLPADKLKTALSVYAQMAGAEVEDLFKLFTDSADAAGKKWKSLLNEMPHNVAAIFEQLITGLNLTATEAAGFANIVSSLANRFGATNAQSFLNLFSGLDEADKESLIGSLSGVTWTGMTEEAIADRVKNIIESSDIEIGLAAQDDIVQALNLIAGNGFSIEKQQEQYRNLQSLLKDVADDGRISAEQYSKLSDLEKSYFQVMADGTAMLTASAAEFYRQVQESFNTEWTTKLTGAFTDAKTAEEKVLDLEKERKYVRGELNAKITDISSARDSQFGYREAMASDVVRQLTESGALSGQNKDVYDQALKSTGSVYDALMALRNSSSEMMAGVIDGAIGLTQITFKTQFADLTADIKNYDTELKNAKDEYNNFVENNIWEKDGDLAAAKTAANAAKKDLNNIIEQAFQESGGGQQFAQWIEYIKSTNPELSPYIQDILENNAQYTKNISATKRAQQIDSLTDTAYQRWAAHGGDLEMLGDLEAYDRSIARYDDTLSDLQDTYKDLQGEAKFDNLASQFETATDKAEKLENQLVVLKRAALEPLRAEFDTLKAEDFAGNEVAQDLLEQVNKELISGKITQESRDKLQNLLLSGNVNSTQMAWLQNVINLYDSALTKFDEHSDKLTEANRQAREALITTFEESTAQLNDYYDTQIGYLETSISLLDHQVELNKLINGEDSVSADQLEDIAEARAKIYEQRKAELADWSQSYSKLAADDISEEANEVRNQYYQAAQDAAQAEIDMIQAYTDANTAAVTQSIEEILGTSLSALAKLKEEADWTAATSARYLNDREKSYSFDTMKYQFDSVAKEYESLEIRELINDAYEKELAALEARDALTEADYERAEKRLELLKAQIALERAEQDMSNMRLVRGANGEYSYQFVADRSKIAEKEQAKRDAEKAVYDAEVAAVQDVSNQAYDSFNALTDYLKEAVSDGVIDADEQRRITKMQEDAERSVESILPTLNELGETLGYNTKDNPDWWKTVDLSEHGVPTELIAGLLKNLDETGDLSKLDNLSVESLKEKLSTFNGDILWGDIIKAANKDAENAAENMVDPEYLKGQIDRVITSLNSLARGEEIPEWVWNNENDAASSAPKAPTANKLKPVISRLDGIQVENMIRNGVATTVSTFEGVNNRVHLTPVDAGNGTIEQKVEIVANFPDATDRDEIKAAFDNLIGLAVQHANQNVKGK